MKFAQTTRSWFAVTLQPPAPLHAPPQPANVEFASACAVSDTVLPADTVIVHALGQSIPAGDEVMRPAPLPTGWTLTRAVHDGAQIATTLAFIGFSLPTFFTGLVFILVFSLWLDWLPFIYRADISASGWRWWWEHARQAAMPVAVLGLFQGATLTRFVRSAVLDVVRLDYVNTARAKGLSEGVTVMKHVIRNALIPVVTLVALQIPGIFTGAVITEQIFRIPGIGSLLISSILANDTPVIMAITFVFSCLVVIFNLVADLLYGWLDPRIAYR